MHKIRFHYDLCTDSSGPKTILHPGPIKDAYIDLKRRGVKMRMITEITNENLAETKELMQMAEVRHLEAISGNFVIADNTDYAGAPETIDGILTKLMVSNVSAFVKQQRYFFETLWEKAIPAEQRIAEIEDGIELEKTEIIHGMEKIIKSTFEAASKTKKIIDNCIDKIGPSSFFNVKEAWNLLIDLQKRGIKLRFITEITPENIHHCKALAEIVELRHLDQVKWNFGIHDGTTYRASASVLEGLPPKVLVTSTARAIVEQQQIFFEMLWETAIPAEQRIKEIEERIKPEKTEIIQDTRKSISLAFEIMKRTKEELLILFATPRTFILGFSLGSVDIYDQMSKRGVNVRLLVPKGSQIENEVTKIKELNPSINVRISDADLNTNITILVADRKEFISWELRDDTLSDPYEAGEIATYSNIQSLATSYGTIFDKLWNITEFAENLKVANVRLEMSEKSMKEFIDVAAHELRTPIQPLIGLAEVLREKTRDPDQLELFDAIVRNAERLQRLQEDILDVTKIENQLISYEKEIFNIDEVIAQVVRDVKKSSKDSNASEILTDLQSNSIVEGDKQRIVQVVVNLLGNSLKFTKNGTINISSRRRGGQVLVNVIDTGTGIDPEIMPKLFLKFATKSPTGTGLGLFISKSIIEGHRGKIWAENNKSERGASFTFSLPIGQ